MKRMILIMALFLPLISCDDDSSHHGPIGTAPEILDVRFVNVNSVSLPFETNEFSIGDWMDIEIDVYDPDKDVVSMHVKIEDPWGHVEEVDNNDLPTMTQDYFSYYTLESAQVGYPTGTYKIEITLWDAGGNASKVFKKNIYVGW